MRSLRIVDDKEKEKDDRMVRARHRPAAVGGGEDIIGWKSLSPALLGPRRSVYLATRNPPATAESNRESSECYRYSIVAVSPISGETRAARRRTQ